jgi:hypothetical protein
MIHQKFRGGVVHAGATAEFGTGFGQVDLAETEGEFFGYLRLPTEEALQSWDATAPCPNLHIVRTLVRKKFCMVSVYDVSSSYAASYRG